MQEKEKNATSGERSTGSSGQLATFFGNLASVA